MGSIADTFTWCETCWFADTKKKITNYGGECCILNKKRSSGKLCNNWIRKKECEPAIIIPPYSQKDGD
jgi:hypothetical protein